LLDRLPEPADLAASLAALCRGAVDVQPILHAFKASQQLRVGVRDILGRQDAETTTAALAALAEAVLAAAVRAEEARLVDQFGVPTVGGAAGAGRAEPVVLAMGKFGGREMNYASDLDVVFLYDHDGTTTRRRRAGGDAATTNAHFFGELALRVARACNVLGPQGRLYELDSRLRPLGRSGPPAIALDEFARHFAAAGPAAVWERQALLKARVVVGGPAAVARVGEIVAAATWGRRWTAAEIGSIRDMRLRMEEGARASNLKRGPGGVVDIEFIVQMLQLVHGGREPRLRTTGTLAGLVAAHDAGLVHDERFEFLSRAYRTLRAIEGRLRLLDAPGRHDLPAGADDRRRLANLLGSERPDDLAADVEALRGRTRAEFEAVCAETIAALP
jgi:glutamate-ammonia-ligase adenylyltransferase